MLKISVVGLGRQALKDHIPAIIESQAYRLVSVCDVDPSLSESIATKFNVEGFTNLQEMIAAVKSDVAIVAVPHSQYLSIIEVLADAGISIVKEKPFATTIEEACAIHRAVNQKVFLGVTLQRRFDPIYQAFMQMKQHLGRIFSVEGRYTLNISNLGVGWRASREAAGGGALVDMGYHLVDLLVWYFGVPQTVTARITGCNRDGQQYDVEDTANLLFDYVTSQAGEHKIVGNFLISRVYPQKQESICVYGSKGILELQQGRISRYGIKGDEIERLERQSSWPSALIDQLDSFAHLINEGSRWNQEIFEEHLSQVSIIEAAYDSDKKLISCRPDEYFQVARERVSKHT